MTQPILSKEDVMTEHEALEEAVRLFEGYGLIAGQLEGDPLAAGRWINNARAALAATPALGEDYQRGYIDGVEFAMVPATPAVGGKARDELTKMAAECHRAKWQFDLSEDFQPSKSAARALILQAFHELHRIGDLAMKARDALAPPASPLRGREKLKDGMLYRAQDIVEAIREGRSDGDDGFWLTEDEAVDAIASYVSHSASPPEPVADREETKIELLAYKLAGAELDYRIAYEKCGGDSINTGRAWDKMRLAGDAIRKYEPPDQG